MIQTFKDYFKKQSISLHVFYFELLLVVIGVLMIMVININFKQQLEEQKSEYIHDALYQKVTSINNELSDIEETMIHASYNQDIINLLKTKTNPEMFEYARDLDEYVTQLKILEDDIDNIIFINSHIKFNMSYDPAIREKIESKTQQIGDSITPTYLGMIEEDDGNLKLLFGNSVYDSFKTLDKIGQMIFVINASLLRDELVSDIGDFMIVDNDNNILIMDNEDEDGFVLDTSEDIIKLDGWKYEEMTFSIVAKSYQVELSDSTYRMNYAFAIFVTLLIIILLFSYLFVSRNVVRHLRRINDFIQSISKGDFRNLKKRLDIHGAKELSEISEEINHLLEELDSLTKRLVQSTSHLYKAEISKKVAELNYLKSQINPHFLYNTLNIVKSIAVINEQKEIEDITMSLVKIFRYSIKGDDFVQLSQELEIINAYIQIQMIRFEDSFEVTFEIEDHLLESEILKMVIQPILENAIQHGVESTYDQNHILISGVEKEGYIEYVVKDDGIGIEADQLQQMIDELNNDDLNLNNKHHIGINNVHQRLKHYYGNSSGLIIESQHGQGTKVTIRIDSSFVD